MLRTVIGAASGVACESCAGVLKALLSSCRLCYAPRRIARMLWHGSRAFNQYSRAKAKNPLIVDFQTLLFRPLKGLHTLTSAA